MRAGPKDGHASPSDSRERTRVGKLRRPAQFEAVLRSGVRVSTRNFVARALSSEGDATIEMPRLGMIAGRKAASRAVDRNRAKRLIRETFRANASAFAAYDVAIQLRSDLRSENNEAVRAELKGLLASLARRCSAESARTRGTAAPAAATNPPAGIDPGAEPHRQQ